MNKKTLEEVLGLIERTDCILVATASGNGMPHLAVAGKLEGCGDDCVKISSWFCPGTVVNLGQNPKISLVVWDRLADKGFQLLGQVKSIEELEMLDGYLAQEAKQPTPQINRQIIMRVDKIIEFKQAPHSDIEK